MMSRAEPRLFHSAQASLQQPVWSIPSGDEQPSLQAFWSLPNPDRLLHSGPGPAFNLEGTAKSLLAEEAAWFQAKFKSLKDIPVSMIGKLSFSTLLQLNEALAQDESASKKLEADARMAMNADSLLKSPNVFV